MPDMPDVSFDNLLIISAVAVLAPLVIGFLPRLRISAANRRRRSSLPRWQCRIRPFPGEQSA
jgi:hypothetical protein